MAGFAPQQWPLPPTVFALGFANGVFAVSALGLMMSFAGASRSSREGVRMGVWGAAQAAAFGIGGFAGASALDLMRHLLPTLPAAFASVFGVEAMCFVAAAAMALRLDRLAADPAPAPVTIQLA
jgi:BCD family chlorophyll transporter-like MFS transporter